MGGCGGHGVATEHFAARQCLQVILECNNLENDQTGACKGRETPGRLPPPTACPDASGQALSESIQNTVTDYFSQLGLPKEPPLY